MPVIKLKKFAELALFMILATSFFHSPAHAEKPSEPDKKDLLKRIIKPDNQLNFQGTAIQILVGKDGVPVVRKFSISRQGKEFVKTEVEGGAPLNEVYVKNGQGTWVYDPAQGKMVEGKPSVGMGKSSSAGNEDKLKQIENNYEIKFIENNNIAGRACAVYSFRPKEKGRLVREFWVDTASGLPLRIDTFGPDGRLLNIASFEAIEFNPESQQQDIKSDVENKMPREEPQVLDIGLPPRQELQNAMGEEVQFPSYIPKGYWLKNVFMQRKNDEKIYQLIYSDGIVPLSIFQKKAKDDYSNFHPDDMEVVSFGVNDKGYFKQKGMVKIFCFTRGNEKNTIIGEIGKDEMIKIAESLYVNEGGAVK